MSGDQRRDVRGRRAKTMRYISSLVAMAMWIWPDGYVKRSG